MTEPMPLAHEAIHVAVEDLLRDAPRGRVLDVPGGEGALAQRLGRIGFNVSCCDLYPELFKLVDVEIKPGDLDTRLPYDDHSFDFVVCIEGLEHIKNPSNAISEFSRILNAKGILIVSVPNILNIEERFKWLINGYTSHFKPISTEFRKTIPTYASGREEIALHVNPIGYSEVRYLLEKYGFALDGVYRDKEKRYTWAYLPAVWLIRLLNAFSSTARRKKRWQEELNSNEVLCGGNTLIFKATKI